MNFVRVLKNLFKDQNLIHSWKTGNVDTLAIESKTAVFQKSYIKGLHIRIHIILWMNMYFSYCRFLKIQ